MRDDTSPPAPAEGSPPGDRRSTNPTTRAASFDGVSARGLSRRSFIKTVGASAAASSLVAAAESSGAMRMARQSGDGTANDTPIAGPGAIGITLNVNGKPAQLQLEPATTLLEALRINLGLTGSKEICDRGACGGCSVIIDGKLVNSCMLLAVDCVGQQITTVESLGTPDNLDPIQLAFVKHDAMQCGYCTPGFVIASKALLMRNPKPTLEQIKRGLAGNICRCGTYTNMFNAVLEASGQAPIVEQSVAQKGA